MDHGFMIYSRVPQFRSADVSYMNAIYIQFNFIFSLSRWSNKQDYEEGGRAQVDRKFP